MRYLKFNIKFIEIKSEEANLKKNKEIFALSSSNFGNNRPKIDHSDIDKRKKEREQFREQKKMMRSEYNIEVNLIII